MDVIMNKEAIKAIIPHRDPFMLIDEITQLDPGKHVVALKHLKEDEFWFKGHFPGQPVQPGVLMIEMLAQAGAVCVLSMPENKGKIAFFAGIEKARFRRMVYPGETLTLEVTLTKFRGSVGFGTAVATVDGQKAVSAEISFVISAPKAE
jgi:3-hydroxyacyl-[acyl-carrier-protein] dehydratase